MNYLTVPPRGGGVNKYQAIGADVATVMVCTTGSSSRVADKVTVRDNRS